MNQRKYWKHVPGLSNGKKKDEQIWRPVSDRACVDKHEKSCQRWAARSRKINKMVEVDEEEEEG